MAINQNSGSATNQTIQVLREGVHALAAIAQNLQSISATLQRMEVKRK